jgi:hypothetical protein
LLEPLQVLRLLEHLRRRLADLAESLVNGLGRLRGALEPPVDLGVELGQAPVHGRDHGGQTPVDLRRALAQLRRAVGAQVRQFVPQEPRDPHEDRAEGGCEDDDEDHGDHRARER